jgi:hypothetical protein
MSVVVSTFVSMSTRVFISFDYDHDSDLKELLVGQSKNPDSPFEISDWSIKDQSPNWRDEARRRIRNASVVAVICGAHTANAEGVAIELEIAQELGVRYFLLQGRSGQTPQKPRTASATDRVYPWTWEELRALVGGAGD